jgi:hypothetical protein
MEGFGIAGTLLMASTAPRTSFDGEDWVVGALATGHGVWQGIGTARLFAKDDPRRLAGGIMLSTAAGGVAGALISQKLELSLAETFAGFSGTLWGAWLGAWLGVVYGGDMHADAVGVSALASDVGLVLTSLAVSRVGNMPPAQVGYINIVGVGGALTGAAIGVLVPVKMNIQKGTLFGTAAALVAGAVLTSIFDLGTTTPVASPASAPGPVVSSSTSWRLPEWAPEVELAMPVVGAPPPVDPQWRTPSTGFCCGLQGLYR